MRRFRAYMLSKHPRLYARLLGEYPPVPIVNEKSDPSRSLNLRIANVVYQTWESNKLGKTHSKQIERFRKINPEFDFVLYSSRQRDEYMEEYYGRDPVYKIYQNGVFGPLKTDIWRYCMLLERGGMYFDINKGCDAPLRSLISNETRALISFEWNVSPHFPGPEVAKMLQFPHNTILNWGLAYEKGHPFLRKVIDNIVDYYPLFCNRVFTNVKDAILKFTGPWMYTKSIHEALAMDPEIPFDQAGIDFNGSGIVNMEGSWVRYIEVPPYLGFRNTRIIY